MSEPVEPTIVSLQALFSALLEQSHEGIALLDSDGRILLVNPVGAAAMGSSAADTLIGQDWIERWPEAARPDAAVALSAARDGTVARFAGTTPDADGGERWWDVTMTFIDAESGGAILAIARDLTAETTERQRAASIMAETQHRLKNAMAIASGIVGIAARSQPEHRAFAQEVGRRFAQLATVQELILDPAREKRFADILPLLTGAYGDAGQIRFDALPDVVLDHAHLQALALTFGELATNSLKYGALGQGQPIDIAGHLEDRRLTLTWREPTAFGTPREGAQGLRLIDRLIAAAGGSVARETSDGELLVTIKLPVPA